jgi:hypothetical protein
MLSKIQYYRTTKNHTSAGKKNNALCINAMNDIPQSGMVKALGINSIIPFNNKNNGVHINSNIIFYSPPFVLFALPLLNPSNILVPLINLCIWFML